MKTISAHRKAVQATVSTRGLEHTLSHTRTKVSTSTKLAAKKVRGGRVRGMLVLAHMNTAKWQRMDSQQRHQAVQCPCVVLRFRMCSMCYLVRVSIWESGWMICTLQSVRYYSRRVSQYSSAG